jgi:hypothetical protein
LTGFGQAIGGSGSSGFIDNMPKLEADKDRPGTMMYKVPGLEMKKYTKFMLAPVEIWYAPDSKYKGISPDDLKAVADTLRGTVKYELEPDWPVVSRPGPGVLGMRIAITNVYVKKKKKTILSFTPIGLAVTAGMAMAGKNISLLDATIEVEMIDTETNERVGVMATKISDQPGRKKGKKTSWEEIKNTLDFYAQRFRSRIDVVHGQ